MTERNVEFIFDFGSPNAYLALKALAPVAARHGASVTLVPCLLGGIFKITGNQPPMVAFGGVAGKLAYERLETERFVAKHSLSRFRFNPHFPINALLLMRGMVAAGRMGVEAPYVEAVLQGTWEDGRKMDDVPVFIATLDDAGLDGSAIHLMTQDPTVKEELQSNTAAAAARGVFGIPTFFVGEEMFFGKERIAQVDEALGTP